MSSVNGLCLPVCPVDVLLKQSHCKDVGDIFNQNYIDTGTKCMLVKINEREKKDTPKVCVTCVSVGSIQARKCDIVLSSIGPVDAVIDKIQC